MRNTSLWMQFKFEHAWQMNLYERRVRREGSWYDDTYTGLAPTHVFVLRTRNDIFQRTNLDTGNLLERT